MGFQVGKMKQKSMEMHDSNDHPNELPKCTLSIVLKMVEMVNVRHVLPQ